MDPSKVEEYQRQWRESVQPKLSDQVLAGTKIKVKDEYAAWDRSALRVTEGEGQVTDRLVIDPGEGEGERVEIESSKWGGDANQPVVRLLRDPTLQEAT